MKILIAYDGSSYADAAVDDLRRAGLPVTVEAKVLCAADVSIPPPEGDVPALAEQPPAEVERVRARAAQALEATRQLALQGSERLQGLFPHWQVRAEAHSDSPAWAVIKEADIWRPDLIVVGSHGHTPFRRLLLGSVSHKILTEAGHSVRIGRAGEKSDGSPVRLVLGADGSPGAIAAAQAMGQRSWPQGSEARVVVALEADMVPQETTAQSAVAVWQRQEDTTATAWAQRMAETLSGPLRATGLMVSSVLQEADPKHLLLDIAEQWQADMICIGARGLSGIERLILGSVSTAVATRASCSVEVIRS